MAESEPPPVHAQPLAPHAPDAQAKRILSECDVFIRYGLKDKAVDRLNQLLDMDPENIDARRRLKDLYLKSDQASEALVHLLVLAEAVKANSAKEAAGYLREALQIDPHNDFAREELQKLEAGDETAEAGEAAAEADDDVIFLDEAEGAGEEAEEAEDEAELLEQDEEGEAELAEGQPSSEEPAEEPEEEPEGEVAEALDEVEFYLSQGLLSEARDTIEDALASFPDSRALQAKLREIEAQESPPAEEEAEPEAEPEPEPAPAPPPARAPAAPPVADKAIDSHYDLGLAYMEMDLFDKSINEFKQCLVSPDRRRASHTMIGLCYVRKGEVGEAIEHFKEGLEAPSQREAEETELWFELGNAYQLLHQTQEALSYFRRVADRDPGFRDVRQRIERLSKSKPTKGKDEMEELDVLFDDLIIKD